MSLHDWELGNSKNMQTHGTEPAKYRDNPQKSMQFGDIQQQKPGDDPKQVTYFIQQAINTWPAEMKIYCRFNRKSCGQQTNIDIPNRSRVAEDAAKSNTLPNSIASMRWISARNVKELLVWTGTSCFGQWKFQDPKMEVPTIYKAYFSGLCKGISPQNMALYGTVPPF